MNRPAIWEAVKYACLSPILFTAIFYAAMIIGTVLFWPLLIVLGSQEGSFVIFLTIVGYVILSIGSAYASLRISIRVLKARPDLSYKSIALVYLCLVFVGGIMIAQMVTLYGSPIADLKYIIDGVNDGYSLSYMSASPAVLSIMIILIAAILSTVGFVKLRKQN